MNSQHLGVASGFLAMALAHAMALGQVIAPPLGNLPGQQGGNLLGQQGGNQGNNPGGGGLPLGGGQQGNNNTNTNALVSLTRPRGVAAFTPGYVRLNARAGSVARYQKGIVTDPALLGQGIAQGGPRGVMIVATNGAVGWGANLQGGQAVGQGGRGVVQPRQGTTPGAANLTPAQPVAGGFPGVPMFSLRNLETGSAATPSSPAPRASFATQRLRLRLQQTPAE